MIQEFQQYISSIKRLSDNTVTEYGKDLTDFVHHIKAINPTAQWSKITREDIDQYMMAMTDEGKEATTINRRLAALRSLFDYMRRQGWITANPARYETRQKEAKKLPNVIDIEELNTAYRHSAGTIRIMLTLLMGTGIRIGEMLAIRQTDIEPGEGRIKIQGKGNKERYVYLEAEKMEEVRAYAEGRGHTIFGEITQRAARAGIYNHLRRYCSARQLSPHAIRHTYATQAATRGANVTQLAEILGHSSINTTQKYINMSNSNARQTAMQYSMFN